MNVKSEKEVRMQYMLPHEIQEEFNKLPLIFLPLATLEWHGPHLVLGVDPINAEFVALALAKKIGGVVLPTLYMGTERERSPEELLSLGFNEDSYIVGMDFPSAEGLYKSFYFTEELFALTVRGHIELCIEHGYKYIYLVNGHGAVNHIEVLRRLCVEFSNKVEGVKVDFAVTFPKKMVEEGAIAHAGIEETSLMMYFNHKWVDLNHLPPTDKKLKYKEYSIVDGQGFIGNPGEEHAVPDNLDPRIMSTRELGREIFENTVKELVNHVHNVFQINK